jgi:hypothetical protein
MQLVAGTDRLTDPVCADLSEQREQTMLLEDIRNNQIARGDINPPSLPRRKGP